MAVIPVSCDVNIRPLSDNAAAIILGAGWSLNLALRVWHPNLAIYETLMKNKLGRGDEDAYTYNARNYFELSEDLVDEVLNNELKRLRRVITAQSFFLALTILTIDTTTIMFMYACTVLLIIQVFLMATQIYRYLFVLRLRESAFCNVEERFQRFCETKRRRFDALQHGE